MKKTFALIALLGALTVSQAALMPGESLTPYEIQNVESGKKYCQVCAYGTKAAKVIAFGKLDDAKFWADLKQLEQLHGKYSKNLGVFAQVLDSTDTKAIREAAKKNGITFPVVVAVESDWDDAYKVGGVSRTIYYAQKNKIAWTAVGLEDKKQTELAEQIKKDLKS
ncbi:MAG: TlpA family protein disulfide reductase [Verrucomicrobiales bacterium]